MGPRWIWILAVLSFLSASAAGWCDTPDVPVARVSFSSGDASYLRGDDPEGGWAVLAVNTPLIAGDSVYAPEGSQVEMDLGLGNVVRLDSATQLDLIGFSGEAAQLGLTAGRINLRVRGLPEGYAIEVDTPLAAASVAEAGSYRVLVSGDRVDFDVISGSLSVASNGEEIAVYAGETLEFVGGSSPTYGLYEVPAPDAFDEWSDDRDTARDVSESARYVESGVVGFEDLDTSGDWIEDPVYGNVWVPAGVTEEWAPYSSGTWIWQDPYGWTWVANEPWGWAPFHYGRWAYLKGFWAWIPPVWRPGVRLFYAPALVGFIGGRGWIYGIGWVPLAPGEPYSYPWQPLRPPVGGRYKNVTVFNAVTVVQSSQFGRTRVTPVRVDPRLIMKAPGVGTTLSGPEPTRASLTPRPEKKPSLKALPPAAVFSKNMVAKVVPPPSPVAFSKKLEDIKLTGKPVTKPMLQAQNSGKPFTAGIAPPEGSRAISAYVRRPGGFKAQPGSESRAVRAVTTEPGRTTSASPRSAGEGRPQNSPAVLPTSRSELGPPNSRTVSSPRVVTLPVSPGARESAPAGPPSQQGSGRWTPREAAPPRESQHVNAEPSRTTTTSGASGPTLTPRESPTLPHPAQSEVKRAENPSPAASPQPRAEPQREAPRQEPAKPAAVDKPASNPNKSDNSK